MKNKNFDEIGHLQEWVNKRVSFKGRHIALKYVGDEDLDKKPFYAMVKEAKKLFSFSKETACELKQVDKFVEKGEPYNKDYKAIGIVEDVCIDVLGKSLKKAQEREVLWHVLQDKTKDSSELKETIQTELYRATYEEFLKRSGLVDKAGNPYIYKEITKLKETPKLV